VNRVEIAYHLVTFSGREVQTMARISTGTMTVAIFAVLFGLVGAYALRAALVGEAPEPPAPPKSTPVPLAAHDLPAGRKITMGDMVLVPMTRNDMEARKLPLDKTMLGTQQIIGRILSEPMPQGSPFLTSNLFPEGTGPKLSDRLKPGMRAVTIPIDNLAAVGGSTVEGSHVDVLFRSRPRSADLSAGRPAIPATTVTLLENVEVISVGRTDTAARTRQEEETVDVRNINTASIGRGYGSNFSGDPVVSVTIAVSPDQANVIKTVLGEGSMSLALRASNADGAAAPNKYTLESILGIAQKRNGLDQIEIFRGGWSRQTVAYDNARLVKDELSMVPGLSPNTPFPVPAVLPKAPEPKEPAANPTKPTPNIYNGGAGNGVGGGFGGYGGNGAGYGAFDDPAGRQYSNGRVVNGR
jgi:Flp pilus assembly protein CpaB